MICGQMEGAVFPFQSPSLAAIRAFDVEWSANGAFQVRACFEEPIPVTGTNESLFECVRDTLSQAVRIGLGRADRANVEVRRNNLEICHRQYGGGFEQWERYHDVYLADTANRALRDAEDQARKEYVRREAARQEERNRQIEICKRHYAPFFVCAWWLLPDATIEGYAACALSEDWDQARIEDASRTRAKKIGACVGYYSKRNHKFFEAMSSEVLGQWYSAIGPRWQ
jgi:hypothetical protein